MLSNRKSILEIILIAVFMTFGINLITNELSDIFELKYESEIFILSGIVICLFSICYFLLRIFKHNNYTKSLEGFFIIDKKSKSIIEVDGYDFTEDLKRSFESAFSEDEAIRLSWENNKLTPRFRLENDSQDSLNLVIEATEYFFLEKLSTHLTDYFNKESIDKKLLVELRRNDIPDILLKNRFLELFSKPTDRRAAFLKDEKGNGKKGKNKKSNLEGDVDGEIISSYSETAMFQRFDLTLPPNSSINRTDSNSICINTRRFKIDIKVEFDAYNTVIPRGFDKYYLNKKQSDIMEYQINILFDVRFKIGGFLSRNGWDYYKWLDSFFDSIEHDFSESHFFKRINWDNTYVIIKSLENRNNKTPAANKM